MFLMDRAKQQNLHPTGRPWLDTSCVYMSGWSEQEHTGAQSRFYKIKVLSAFETFSLSSDEALNVPQMLLLLYND